MIDIIGLQQQKRRVQVARSTPPPQRLNDLQGFARFYIEANVSMDTLKEWSPQRITDFFNGIAQVIRARGKSSA